MVVLKASWVSLASMRTLRKKQGRHGGLVGITQEASVDVTFKLTIAPCAQVTHTHLKHKPSACLTRTQSHAHVHTQCPSMDTCTWPLACAHKKERLTQHAHSPTLLHPCVHTLMYSHTWASSTLEYMPRRNHNNGVDAT